MTGFRSPPFALLPLLLMACGGGSDAAHDLPGDTGADVTDASAETTSDTGRESSPVEVGDPEDMDGDGYKIKDDCDDTNPLVNPGAFEIADDKIDNDCDGSVDNPEPDCDTTALKLDSTDAMDFARAMGLCRTTTSEATGKEKRWGVIAAKLVMVDGAGTPNPLQHGILTSLGPYVKPRQGKQLVALSSGTARRPTDPGFVVPLSSWGSKGTPVKPPVGFPKIPLGCPTPKDLMAYDSVALQLTIRVPTNAQSLRFEFDFYSSEYINFVCAAFDDQFIALLDSKAPLESKYGKNVAFDTKGEPIGIDDPKFLEVCTPGTAGGRSFPCARGTKELQETGFWDPTQPTENGATSWLRTKAGVVPGETITISFMIWDMADDGLDSTVLLDNFGWDTTPVSVPVTARP